MPPSPTSYRTARRSWMPLRGLGAYGVNKDISPHQLAPAMWSDARNVRFTGDAIETLGGDSAIYPNLMEDETDKKVYWCYNVANASHSYWLAACAMTDNSLTALRIATSTRAWSANPTNVAFRASLDYLWQAENLGGIAILNNGEDVPYEWSPALDAKVQPLRNWPAHLRCRVLVPYNYFLVALNLLDTTDNSRQHEGIRWSQPAAPGTVPVSWDVTDARYLAGETVLPDSGTGEITTALLLRDWLVIYKNNSVWTMRTTGGAAVFAFSLIFQDFGALSANCVGAFSHRGGQFHCVFTGDNALIHDGRSVLHTLDNRMARYISDTLHDEHWKRSYVFVNHQRQEIWINYPAKDSRDGWPNRTVIWNYAHNLLSLADYEELSWMTQGIVHDVPSVGSYSLTDWSYPTWDDIPAIGTWDGVSSSAQWSPETTSRPTPVTVGCSVSVDYPGLWGLDEESETSAVKHFYGLNGCYVTRHGFGYLPDWRTDEPIQDYFTWKIIKSLRVTYGQPFSVSIGDALSVEITGDGRTLLNSLTWTPYDEGTAWLSQLRPQYRDDITDPINKSVAGTEFTMTFRSTASGRWRLTELAFETDRSADQVLQVETSGA